MKKTALVLLLSVILLPGCGGGGETAPPTPTPTPTPPPTETKPTDSSQKPPDSDILNDGEAIASTGPVASGLIPSINPQKRAQQVNKGKGDPFGLVLPPKTIVNSAAPKALIVPPPPKNPAINGGQSGSNNPNLPNSPNNGVSNGKNMGGFKKGASCLNNAEFYEFDIKQPEPVEANSVELTGVVNVAGQNVAIIRTTDYSYSYSVGEGSILHGGKVAVKNVDANLNNPSITLEQYGQSVTRMVGEPPLQKVDQSKLTPTFALGKPKGNQLFGEKKGLMLTKVNIDSNTGADSSSFSGTLGGAICNNSQKKIKVSNVILQIEDNQGKVIGNIVAEAKNPMTGAKIVLNPKEIGFFGTNFRLNTYLKGDIKVRLKDWN